jgi:predicted RNase H-like nuclease
MLLNFSLSGSVGSEIPLNVIAGGSDACRRGWITTWLDHRLQLHVELFASAKSLVNDSRLDLLSVDVPTGLVDSGTRQADDDAMTLLGRRSCTVFPAVLRPVAAAATSHAHAVVMTRALTGRGISAQAWCCVPKIMSFDQAITAADQTRIFECHPELSFAAWNGTPLVNSKKTPGGRHDRRKLVDAWLGTAAFAAVRAMFLRSHVADDDILDSLAALWSSRRIARGIANRIPGGISQVDSRGLTISMWR